MDLSQAAVAVVQSALEELKQAKRAKLTQTSIKAAVDAALSGLELEVKWQLEKHSSQLAAGIENLLASEHNPDTAATTEFPVVRQGLHVTTKSPKILQVHLAASSVSADSAVGLACLLAACCSASHDLTSSTQAVSVAIACLANPSVWQNSIAARTVLLQVVAKCFAQFQSSLIASITGQAPSSAPAASATPSAKRGKRARSDESGAMQQDPAAALAAGTSALSGLTTALASAVSHSSANGHVAALAPSAQPTQANKQQHDSAVAALLASAVLLHYLVAAAEVSVAGDSSAKRTRTLSGGALGTHAGPAPPAVALLAGGLCCSSGSRAAVVRTAAQAVFAASACVAADGRYKSLQHSRGYVAMTLWQVALQPLLQAQQGHNSGLQVGVTPWAHVGPQQAGAAWSGSEWAHLVLAARGVLRITYHVAKAARKAHVGGGAGGGLLLLPEGGQGAATSIGALEKTVLSSMQDLSTPAALTSWCKGELLVQRAAGDVEGGSEDGEGVNTSALEEVAHPSHEDGPMQRLLNRKKMPDGAIEYLAVASSVALEKESAPSPASAAAAMDAVDPASEQEHAAAAAAAVEGLAADADLFMVDTAGDEAE